jgi:hypothetical protein
MRNVTIENVTDAVIGSLGQNGPVTDRQREIMTALLKHLHGFCRDAKLQHHEFIDACRLCCTNPVRDSSCESSVIAGGHEQTEHTDLQDAELARV